MRPVGASGKVTITPMVAESSKGFRLPLTEKIFSKGLTREKPIRILGKRKGKTNANADSSRKEV